MGGKSKVGTPRAAIPCTRCRQKKLKCAPPAGSSIHQDDLCRPCKNRGLRCGPRVPKGSTAIAMRTVAPRLPRLPPLSTMVPAPSDCPDVHSTGLQSAPFHQSRMNASLSDVPEREAMGVITPSRLLPSPKTSSLISMGPSQWSASCQATPYFTTTFHASAPSAAPERGASSLQYPPPGCANVAPAMHGVRSRMAP